MTDGTANSWVMGLEQPVPGIVAEAPSSNGYRRAFAARLSLKDLGIAVNAAKRVGLDPSAGEAAIRAFQKVDADPRTRVSPALAILVFNVLSRGFANLTIMIGPGPYLPLAARQRHRG